MRKAVEIDEKGGAAREIGKTSVDLNEEFLSKNKLLERINDQEKKGEHLGREVLKLKQISLNSVVRLISNF